uniref:p53/p73-a n=1 Tax=Phallusia mammillata TaxID=59560 RepID=A0A6F9DW91_9ASCI|nr:p53/p73-a [Phallusia mammillata]
MATEQNDGLSDSQESFSDFWTTTFQIPDLNDVDLEGIELAEIVKKCEEAVPNENVKVETPTVLDTDVNIVKKEFVKQRPVPSQIIDKKVPFLCVESFSGEHDFQVVFPHDKSPITKCIHHTYSPDLKKLFAKMGERCPLHFTCASPPPPGTVIRAVPVFRQSENMMDIVTRCINHTLQDKSSHEATSHFIRAEMPDAMVEYSNTVHGRESVTVLYQTPDSGKENTMLLYRFMCNSSCPTGINRRPVSLVLTLESDTGEVLGRSVIDIHVSSCPGRDRTGEETKAQAPHMKKQIKKRFVNKRKHEAPKEKDDDNDLYYLPVKGREKYELLKKMKIALDLEELVTPEQKQNYYAQEEENQRSIV